MTCRRCRPILRRADVRHGTWQHDNGGPGRPCSQWFRSLGPADRLETGRTEQLPDGRTLRTFEVEAVDREIEIAPGIVFPAWTFNGRVPGPALRAKEGEKLRIIFRNFGSHPHSMHFHGIHSARMDGVPGAGLIGPGEEFVYEFDAKPFGCHLYHCHALPLKRHMHKGMYGLFVIDPDPSRRPTPRLLPLLRHAFWAAPKMPFGRSWRW